MSEHFPSKKEMEKTYQDIAKRHQLMSKLPIEEKIKCLVSIQKMAKPILKKRGKEIRVWEIGLELESQQNE